MPTYLYFVSFISALFFTLCVSKSHQTEFKLLSLQLNATFLPDLDENQYSRISPLSNHGPDTTIVLLNWSRLSNVVLQVSIYCSAPLEDIVKHVLVWNNKPDLHLEHEKHFKTSNCPRQKLIIHNSADNVYFQARFLGCLLASTPMCFLQDDDYLTRPEILRSVHSYFLRSYALGHSHPIILQPPHDHLESDLLSINVSSNQGVIITSFACLGHGTFILRSHVGEFMSLLDKLSLTPEELKIADNYFTILHGYPPNKWLTHTIELVDKEAIPFTSGIEGENRNWLHINRAMFYLEQLLNTSNYHLPRVQLSSSGFNSQWTSIAPCLLDPCVIKTNIQTFPNYVIAPHVWKQDDMRTLQSERFATLGRYGVSWYTGHPLSHAVDGDPETSFRSFGYAKKGDMLSFSLFGHETSQGESVEVVFLVDVSTASLLYASDVEISADELSWRMLFNEKVICFPTFLSSPQNTFPPSILDEIGWVNFASENLFECHFVITEGIPLQGIRITARSDRTTNWNLHEVWVRQHI